MSQFLRRDFLIEPLRHQRLFFEHDRTLTLSLLLSGSLRWVWACSEMPTLRRARGVRSLVVLFPSRPVLLRPVPSPLTPCTMHCLAGALLISLVPIYSRPLRSHSSRSVHVEHGRTPSRDHSLRFLFQTPSDSHPNPKRCTA
jgi:hypothetical protein